MLQIPKKERSEHRKKEVVVIPCMAMKDTSLLSCKLLSVQHPFEKKVEIDNWSDKYFK